MFSEFYLVFRFYWLKMSIFETPYKLLYSTFNLFKFKNYAWVSCGTQMTKAMAAMLVSLKIEVN